MVVVQVSEGLLEGELMNSDYGSPYYSFKGIPYAQPPVGDLRFKAPQPPSTWEGIRSAKHFGPKCFQNDVIFTKTTHVGDEDCLYLNVYTPDIKPNKQLPVMFWIHGGGFFCGSGEDDFYGPEFLLRQGVIVVTFNYRLEVLGFLCLDTEDIPGNAGMKDQVQALRWVNKNIANFGGDPKNITIFGESAGAGSVSYHLISPMSKGLFQRAIAQSGSALCDWAQTCKPRDRALALARQLGCHSEDDKELYEFFKNQPVESLVQKSAHITLAETLFNDINVQFSIVDEKQFGKNERFFHGNLLKVVSNDIHEGIDLMFGYTTEEGFINMDNNVKNRLNTAINFPEVFVPKRYLFSLTPSQKLDLGKKIRKYYFNDRIGIPDDWESLLSLYSAYILTFGVMQFVKACAQANKNKLYLYKFSCKSERNVFAHLSGHTDLIGNKKVTAHCDDLFYLFDAKILNKKVDSNSDTFKLIDRVTKLWTNFAKFGNPTTDDSLGANWIPYTRQNQHYMDIGNVFTTGTAPDDEEMQFWENALKEYTLVFTN